MNLDGKARQYQEDLLRWYLDPDDFYFYNEVNRELPQEAIARNRNSFIDGLAWSSNLLASCILNPTDLNVQTAERIMRYHRNLDKVNRSSGRFARAYRMRDGEKWEPSSTLPGYFYRDGQAKAGPLAFTAAAMAAYADESKIPTLLKIEIMKLYITFIMRLKQDDYRVLNANGTPSDNGDLRVKGLAGIINGHLLYVMTRLGLSIAIKLGMMGNARLLRADATRFCDGLVSPTLLVRGWTIAMKTWDFLLRIIGKRRQKFSNDHLIYQLFSVYAYAQDIDVLSGRMREKMVEASCIMHEMTKGWQNPYFDCIHMLLAGKRYVFSLSDVGRVLNRYPEERRRCTDYNLRIIKSIVPIDGRKPSSWMWRQNPYELYTGKAGAPFESSWYSPADFVTAYNIYAYLNGA